MGLKNRQEFVGMKIYRKKAYLLVFVMIFLLISWVSILGAFPMNGTQKDKEWQQFLTLVEPFNLTQIVAVQPYDNNISYIFSAPGVTVSDVKRAAVVTIITLGSNASKSQNFLKGSDLFKKAIEGGFGNIQSSQEGLVLSFSYVDDKGLEDENNVMGLGWLEGVDKFMTLGIVAIGHDLSESDMNVLAVLKKKIKSGKKLIELGAQK